MSNVVVIRISFSSYTQPFHVLVVRKEDDERLYFRLWDQIKNKQQHTSLLFSSQTGLREC